MKSFLVVCAACIVAVTAMRGQDVNNAGFPTQVQKDTVCFAYRFEKGDLLRYRVVSHDTVYFKEKQPLIKERIEMLEIACDSVGKDGYFYLRYTLKDYVARESMGDIKNLTRTETPWQGKTVSIVLDTLGKRHHADPAPSSRASALSPGGAFQPVLLIGIFEPCHRVQQSWLVENEDELLVENGHPAPLRRQTALYEVSPSVDTLGFACLQLQYSLTGQGSVAATDRKPAVRMAAIIAEHGEMMLSKEYGVPVHFFGTSQIKMEIETSDGKKVKNTQYTHSYYTLESIKRKGKTTRAQH